MIENLKITAKIPNMQSSVELVLQTQELIQRILIFADYDTVLNYCHTHKEAIEIYRSRIFWEEKAEIVFGIPRDLFRLTELAPVQRYLEFLNSESTVPVEGKYLQLEKFVLWSFKVGREDFINYAVKRGFNERTTLVYQYAKLNNRTMVDQYLDESTCAFAAGGALVGNHKDLFDHIYSLSTKFFSDEARKYYWVNIVANSAESGNPSLFDYVISILPQNYEQKFYRFVFGWEYLLVRTCISGSIKMFEYIRSLIPPGYLEQSRILNIWTDYALTALENNHKELFNHIRLIAPANYKFSSNSLYYGAVRSNNLELLKYISKIVPADDDLNLNTLAYCALEEGNKNMFNYIYSLVVGYQWNWNKLLTSHMMSCDKHLFNYIFSLIPADYQYDWTQIVGKFIHDCSQMVKHVISMIPQDYNLDWNKFAKTGIDVDGKKEGDKIKFLEFIITLAPLNYQWEWNRIIKSFRNTTLNIELFRSLTKLVPPNYPWDWNFVMGSLFKETPSNETIDYVRSLAPLDYSWNRNFL